ncbi:MAG: GerMN domain-containing protein [bacterium]|nr:GerMN domain-containing protein [bacterium]
MGRRRWPLVVVAVVLLALLVGGCRLWPGRRPATTELVLYFPDNQAEYLVRERRTVDTGGKSYEELALRELIAGPRAPGLTPSLPAGTRLLGVTIRDGVAQADFSRELKTEHPGGTAGETFTVFSIVNTLTEIRGVRSALILIEGRRQETLAGHLDISEPLEREGTLIRD